MSTAADEILLGFTRALRAAGVRVTQDRAAAFLRAAALVGAGDPAATWRAGRATLCGSPDDLARYDVVFGSWFSVSGELPVPAPRGAPEPVAAVLPPAGAGEEVGEGVPERVRASATDVEVLRHRDVAALTAAERALVNAMIGSLHPRTPRRRASRRTPWRRGQIDLQRTLRSTLRHLGEPATVAHRRRGTRPRRVVLLIDVSGSMRQYADALLRLAHVLVRADAAGGRAEAFTLGTRLTRVTDALRTADPERALVRAGEQVPDWSGGTRLGETLKVFLDRWGARGLARGAVVVVFSDGWERGDAVELGQQLARLRRLAHKVVWVNPHRGKEGYQPVQTGIVAALPHLDELVAGHSLHTFARVLEVVADA